MYNDNDRLIVRTIHNITYIGSKMPQTEERVEDGIELKVHPLSEMRIFIPYCEIKEIIQSSLKKVKEDV